jgi:hypothetical protein
VQDSDDLLDDLLDGRMESLEIFHRAVARKDPPSYLGRSEHDLVWCTPSEDIEELRVKGIEGADLLQALGLQGIGEDAIEIMYPASAAGPYYKPCVIHAGPDPNFQPAPEDSEFGKTIGGLREAIHLPVMVAKALDSGARFRLWRIS